MVVAIGLKDRRFEQACLSPAIDDNVASVLLTSHCEENEVRPLDVVPATRFSLCAGDELTGSRTERAAGFPSRRRAPYARERLAPPLASPAPGAP